MAYRTILVGVLKNYSDSAYTQMMKIMFDKDFFLSSFYGMTYLTIVVGVLKTIMTPLI